MNELWEKEAISFKVGQMSLSSVTGVEAGLGFFVAVFLVQFASRLCVEVPSSSGI